MEFGAFRLPGVIDSAKNNAGDVVPAIKGPAAFVPEPGATGLVGLGLACVAILRRSRANRD